jgi:Ca-activated chloride channel family protein
MTSQRLLISLSLLLLSWQRVSAQLAPADDFFNSGAQLYISNNIPAALERVEMGLKTYPDDEKLQKLEKLLKQQQQQQNQQQQNQQNQQQSQQDQKQQDKKDQQQKQDQKPQQDQKQNSEQQKQDQQKPSDQKKDEDQKQQQQKKDSGDKPKDEKQDQQPGQPVKAGEMTPEEAKRLLDAQKGNEQLLQMKPQDKPREPNRPVKDW